MAESIAIIGGSGLNQLPGLKIIHREFVRTPYGPASAPMSFGTLAEQNVVFLPRHGYGHSIPPHQVNYRANIWALQEAGIREVVAVNAVGAIPEYMEPASLVIPDQIIDYTWGRESTFFDDNGNGVHHQDFTYPFCPELRERLIRAGSGFANLHIDGVYGATQGPRFETAAEVNKLERDGVHIIGMTGMPEAALARELGLCYAMLAVVANQAAGRAPAELDVDDIEQVLSDGMGTVRSLLTSLLSKLAGKEK